MATLCSAQLAAVPYVECRQRRPPIATYQVQNSHTGWQARIYLKEPSLGEAIRLLYCMNVFCHVDCKVLSVIY